MDFLHQPVLIIYLFLIYTGWHRDVSGSVGKKPPFYTLLQSLYDGASFVSVQVLLVSEGKLRRIQRRSYRTVQARLQQYWEEHEAGERTTIRLLKAASRLFGNLDE